MLTCDVRHDVRIKISSFIIGIEFSIHIMRYDCVSMQPQRASIDIFVSILSPATAQSTFHLHNVPGSSLDMGKKRRTENEIDEEEDIDGVNCGEHNTVSVCHGHDARQLLWKTGRNSKLVLVSLQIIYSQSFPTISMLLFVKQHFSQHFVYFLLFTCCLHREHCMCTVWAARVFSVHTSRMISHSCSPMFRFNLSILCSTYDRRTDFTSCRLRRRRLRLSVRWQEGATLHSFFMRASIIHRIQHKILFTS